MGVLGSKLTPETKAKISAAQKGRTFSEGHRAKLAAAKRGRSLLPEHKANISAAGLRRYEDPAEREKTAAAQRLRCKDPVERAKRSVAQRLRMADPAARAKIAAANRGERSHRWKGDDVGYFGAHYRHQRALAGQPCAHADENCGGRLECALRYDTPAELVKVDEADRRYSTRVEDYIRLCRSHHERYDIEESHSHNALERR